MVYERLQMPVEELPTLQAFAITPLCSPSTLQAGNPGPFDIEMIAGPLHRPRYPTLLLGYQESTDVTDDLQACSIIAFVNGALLHHIKTLSLC